jgi:hydroxymethylbilane synthase
MGNGSRGSTLALRQTEWVRRRLEAAGYEIHIRIIKTTGDRLADAPLTQSGSKGLFIKEIEEALLDRKIDLAVHSLKDLPIELPEGLSIAAIPEREDARDAFVARDGMPWESLPAGSHVGTSSLRRQAQLLALRPDLEIVALRGNIDTRLRKLDRGDCEGIVLALAGLRRLGFESRTMKIFLPEEMCPAVGQGALAIEIRAADAKTLEALASLDHPPTRDAIRAERAALRELGGGCQLPIAAHAWREADSLRIIAVVASPDGSRVFRATAAGAKEQPEILGKHIAEDLLKQGAGSALQLP